MDSDGDQDLLLPTRNGIFWYENNGSGAFIQKGRIAPSYYRGRKRVYAVEDLNKDGKPDVLVCLESYSHAFGRSPSQIKVCLNDGTGVFLESKAISFPYYEHNSSNIPHFLVDFNQDGYPDILMGKKETEELIDGVLTKIPPYVTVLINDGTGTFSEKPEPLVENFLLLSASFDHYNEDTYPDLVIKGVQHVDKKGAFKVLLNDGSGGFEESQSLATEGFANFNPLNSVDIDADGNQDLVVFTYRPNDSYDLLLNNGNAQFSESFARFDYEVPAVRKGSRVSAPRYMIAFPDVDGDGDPDVIRITEDGDLVLFRNNIRKKTR